MKTWLTNAIIWHNDTFIHDHTLVIEDGRITAIVPANSQAPLPDDHVINADGKYILPGFVDVHIHGSNGFDTMDATEEALQGMCDFLLTQGVTSFLATTMSAEDEEVTRALENAKQFAHHKHTPYIGVHLEGPYLSAKHRGSQPDTHLRAPIKTEYTKWFASGQVKLMTIAPELEGSDDLIKIAREHGITVSLGHSGATYEQTVRAFELGLGQMTHTFNGVVGIHHREPGALVAMFLNPDVPMQIIPDGVHVHPAMVKFLVQTIGIERVLIITDAMRAAGLKDGDYLLGDVAVTVKNGEARTSAGGLAGSTLTMPDALRNMMAFCDLSLSQVIPMLTSIPAKSIDMFPQKGAICAGADADLVIWDESEGVVATVIAGETVYEAHPTEYAHAH